MQVTSSPRAGWLALTTLAPGPVCLPTVSQTWAWPNWSVVMVRLRAEVRPLERYKRLLEGLFGGVLGR